MITEKAQYSDKYIFYICINNNQKVYKVVNEIRILYSLPFIVYSQIINS